MPAPTQGHGEPQGQEAWRKKDGMGLRWSLRPAPLSADGEEPHPEAGGGGVMMHPDLS